MNQKIITLAGITIGLALTGLAQFLPNASTVFFPTDPAKSWSRILPATEPFGEPPAWIAISLEGQPQIVAPTSALAINHEKYGYAVRPGNWHWRKIDENLRRELLAIGYASPAIENPSVGNNADRAELADLKERVSRALEALTGTEAALAPK